MAGCCAFSCKAFSLYKPYFNCSRRVPTALGLAGRAGRLPGLAQGPRRRCQCGGGAAQLSSPLRWGSWPASLCPHRLACSHAHLVLLGELQPVIGLQPVNVVGEVRHGDGGVVAHACKRYKEEGEENGYGSAWPRKARQQHVHSKLERWVQGGHV